MARDAPRKLSTLGIMSEQSNPVDSIPLKKRSEISRKIKILHNPDNKLLTQNTKDSTKNKTHKPKKRNTENDKILGSRSEQSEETDSAERDGQNMPKSRNKNTHHLSNQNQNQNKKSDLIKPQKDKTLLNVGDQDKKQSPNRNTNKSKDIRRISIPIPADDIQKLKNTIAAKQFDLVNHSSSPEQDFGIYSRNQTISMIRRGSGQGKQGMRHIDFMGSRKATNQNHTKSQNQSEYSHPNSGKNQISVNISNRAQLGARSKLGSPMVRAVTTQNQIMRGIIEEEGTL